VILYSTSEICCLLRRAEEAKVGHLKLSVADADVGRTTVPSFQGSLVALEVRPSSGGSWGL
jgi:hypothetical protein